MPLTAFIFDAKRFSSTAPILAAERLSAISAAPLLLHLDFSVRPVITCVIAVYISFSAFRLFVLSLLISLHNLRTCFSTCLFANQQGHRLFCSSARTSSLFCSPASTSRLDTIHCGFCFYRSFVLLHLWSLLGGRAGVGTTRLIVFHILVSRTRHCLLQTSVMTTASILEL